MKEVEIDASTVATASASASASSANQKSNGDGDGDGGTGNEVQGDAGIKSSIDRDYPHNHSTNENETETETPLDLQDDDDQDDNNEESGGLVSESPMVAVVPVPMSPNSMAEAAYRAGVEQRKQRDRDRDHDARIELDSVETDESATANASKFTSSNVNVTEASHSKDIDQHSITGSNRDGDDNGPSTSNKRRRVSLDERDVRDRDRHGADMDVGNTSIVSTNECQYHQSNCNIQSAYQQAELQLTNIWNKQNQNNLNLNEHDIDIDIDTPVKVLDSSLEETKKLVLNQLDTIIRCGLDAFNHKEELQRELSVLREVVGSRDRDIRRMKASEEDLRASVSNLLKAVESSKSSARDASRAAQIEARLRSEVSNARIERDTISSEYSESKRKTGLLQEEVRLLRTRIVRLTQEKIKVERDSRAALSLARSMDTHAASDVDYYKRKVSDLNDHLQAKADIVTELKHQVDEYKRQMQRSISQNRLAQLRSDEASGSGSGSGSGSVSHNRNRNYRR